MHCEDQVENGQMTFDYKLRPGIVTKSNARSANARDGAGCVTPVTACHRMAQRKSRGLSPENRGAPLQLERVPTNLTTVSVARGADYRRHFREIVLAFYDRSHTIRFTTPVI